MNDFGFANCSLFPCVFLFLDSKGSKFQLVFDIYLFSFPIPPHRILTFKNFDFHSIEYNVMWLAT